MYCYISKFCQMKTKKNVQVIHISILKKENHIVYCVCVYVCVYICGYVY